MSSLVASILILGGGWFGSFKFRRFCTRTLGKLAKVDILAAFPTQRDAAGDVTAALEQAAEVSLFVGRGSELTRATFDGMWNAAGGRIRKIRVLLPDPEMSGPGSWFADRENEMAGHDTAYGDNLIAEQVKTNLRYLMGKAAGKPEIEVRVYDFPHLGRLIITDKSAFLTTYRGSEHGSASPCLLFSRSGPLYDFCMRIFDKAWMKAKPYRLPARPATATRDGHPRTRHRE
ncbi:hypothetical protein AB0H12_37740 [Actinosynnema sp. NPDC023794]